MSDIDLVIQTNKVLVNNQKIYKSRKCKKGPHKQDENKKIKQ